MKKLATLCIVALACGGGTPAGDDGGLDAAPDVAPLADATPDSGVPEAAADVVVADVAEEPIDSGPQSQPWLTDFGMDYVVGFAANAKAGLVAMSGEDTQYASTFLAVYDANGSPQWSKSPTGTFGKVAIDDAGDVYALGQAGALTDYGAGPVGSAGAVVVKYDSAGNLQWVYGPLSSTYVNDVAVKSNGNVVVAGSFVGTQDFGGGPIAATGAFHHLVFVELTPSKGFVRTLVYGDGSADPYVTTLAIDASDDLIFAGLLEGTVDFGGGALVGPGESAGYASFLVKLGPTGAYQHQIFNDQQSSAYFPGIAVDSKGNIGICGYFDSAVTLGQKSLLSAGSYDLVVGELDSSFGVIWNKRFGDAQSQLCKAAAFDAKDELVIGGTFLGNVSFGLGYLTGPGAFVARFDATGNPLASAVTFGVPVGLRAFIAPDLAVALQATSSASIGNAMFTGTLKGNDALAGRFLPP